MRFTRGMFDSFGRCRPWQQQEKRTKGKKKRGKTNEEKDRGQHLAT